VRQVSTIYATGDNYNVVVEFNPKGGWSPERLDEIFVRASNGTLVPVGAFAKVERTAGLQLTVNQLGQLPAVTISYNLPAGVALGDSVNRIEALKAEIGLPKSLSTTLAGTAKTFQDSLANQGLLIAGAILTIYIVLGMLYESFIHPLTILIGPALSGAGALCALRLFNLDLSIIASSAC
jgi:HAE1 family hydrophobic/amphiphilic exporter-1